MKIKCRFFIAILLLAYFTTGTIAFGAANDILSTYESDLSIMTVDATGATESEADAKTDPALEAQAVPPFKVNAKAAILIEANTGKVLFALNENETLPIASITKIMTMLLLMEAIDSGKVNPSDTTTISAYATGMGGSGDLRKEVFTIEELLKAVAVHSANDASVALAEVIARSEKALLH